MPGEKGLFVQVDNLFNLLQKVFSQSDAARDEWKKVTGVNFPSHSDVCWYSKYVVMEVISKFFPDLLTVMTDIAEKKVSLANSGKLLQLLLDESKC